MIANDLKDRYSALCDSELMQLAVDRDALTDVAKAVLDEELSRRSLGASELVRFVEEMRPEPEAMSPDLPCPPRRPVGVVIIAGLLLLFALMTCAGLLIVVLRFGRWTPGVYLGLGRAVLALSVAWGLFRLQNWARIVLEAGCLLEVADCVYTIITMANNPFWRAAGREVGLYLGIALVLILGMLAFIWDYLRSPAIKVLFGHISLPRIEPLTSGDGPGESA